MNPGKKARKVKQQSPIAIEFGKKPLGFSLLCVLSLLPTFLI